MTEKELEKKYLQNLNIKHHIRKTLKQDKDALETLIKENIDSKFIKYINIKNDVISFKANKKLRDKMEKDESFLDTYVFKFISQILNKHYDKTDYITCKTLNSISDIIYMDTENKIFVRI